MNVAVFLTLLVLTVTVFVLGGFGVATLIGRSLSPKRPREA
jgi:hypothetical protein